MSQTFWFAVLAIGITQGTFLTAALLVRSGTNRAATRILATVVAVLTTMILGEMLEATLPARFARFVTFLNINTELAIGPLGLLFVRSIVQPERRRGLRDALHFAPMALGLIGWSVAWAWTGGDAVEPSDAMSRMPGVGYFVLFKAGFFLVYMVATYLAMDRALRKQSRFSVGRRSVRLEWLKRWLIGLAVIPALIYTAVLLERRGLSLPVEPDQLGSLLLTTTLYLASLMVLLRPWVLSLTPREETRAPLIQEANDLEAYLERERPWLEPELGLADLAEALGRSQKHLSLLINEGLDSSFYGLMTRYRLAEFERLAEDPAFRERGVLDLAFDAGFNSKASFYRAFRENHGTTPAAYRKALQQI